MIKLLSKNNNPASLKQYYFCSLKRYSRKRYQPVLNMDTPKENWQIIKKWGERLDIVYANFF